MGQYWKAVIGNEQGSNIRTLGIPNRAPKLTEHAYFGNDYVEFVCWTLCNKCRVCWLGDYATDEDFELLYKADEKYLPDISIEELNQNDYNCISIPNEIKFKSNNKFLLNHDTKEYLDLEECITISEQKSLINKNYFLIFHPLPLLTAIGNDKGLGDFHEGNIGYENVGKWAWNLISIEQEEPINNYKKVQYYFAEKER